MRRTKFEKSMLFVSNRLPPMAVEGETAEVKTKVLTMHGVLHFRSTVHRWKERGQGLPYQTRKRAGCAEMTICSQVTKELKCSGTPVLDWMFQSHKGIYCQRFYSFYTYKSSHHTENDWLQFLDMLR